MLCDTCSFGVKRKLVIAKEKRVQGESWEYTNITCVVDKWMFDEDDDEIIECSRYHQTNKSKENLDEQP